MVVTAAGPTLTPAPPVAAGLAPSAAATGPRQPANTTEALALIDQAQALATRRPPDVAQAEALLGLVKTWLVRVASGDNVRAHFQGRGFNLTSAEVIAADALAAVEGQIRRLSFSIGRKPTSFEQTRQRVGAAAE